MNKETCKQCIANLGLTWENREDMCDSWKDTERRWNMGRITCPAVYSHRQYIHSGTTDGSPPPWCPHGFENRVRELKHENV